MEKLYYVIDRISRKGEKEELKVEIKVIGNRTSFGREEVEITPASGSGAWWIHKGNLISLKTKHEETRS